MNVVKKSFDISGDLAQRLDDYTANNPGMSFTLIINQALEAWLSQPSFSGISAGMSSNGNAKMVKKSANIKEEYHNRIDSLKAEMPGFNATLILNQALMAWLKDPKFKVPSKYTEADVDEFLDENSELMDQLAK